MLLTDAALESSVVKAYLASAIVPLLGFQMMTSYVSQSIESGSITVKVLFFASAREAAGNVSSTDLELEDGADTALLRTRLSKLYPKLAEMVLDEDNLTLALNEEYVASGQTLPLKNGDTVALIPPISGG
eukprot:scaffold1377_cov126-Cylindrotheca_fusiformis.AAC.1